MWFYVVVTILDSVSITGTIIYEPFWTILKSTTPLVYKCNKLEKVHKRCQVSPLLITSFNSHWQALSDEDESWQKFRCYGRLLSTAMHTRQLVLVYPAACLFDRLCQPALAKSHPTLFEGQTLLNSYLYWSNQPPPCHNRLANHISRLRDINV